MLSRTLAHLNLDPKEIEIYLQLLKLGVSRASIIARHTKLPRTTAQNILMRLEKEGIVTKQIEKNVYLFSPVHPENLSKVLEVKKRETASQYDKQIEELKKVTPQLVSMMQSSQSLPNVSFYRGKDAIRKVLFDTLTSKTELKDFANIDAMFEHVQKINDEYVAEREGTKITKRSLLLDTPFAREIYERGTYSSKSHKGYKWINQELYPFALEMNIYDGKVSYITYVKNDFVGVIIENDHIYQLHDSLWNLIWNMLPEPKEKKS